MNGKNQKGVGDRYVKAQKYVMPYPATYMVHGRVLLWVFLHRPQPSLACVVDYNLLMLRQSQEYALIQGFLPQTCA